MTAQKRPAGLKTSGRKLWDSMISEFGFEEWERVTLLEACRTADRLDALASAQRGQPLTVTNSKGDEVTSPYLVESRMLGAAYSRLIAALRIPDDAGNQPQRRGGARTAYNVQGLKAVK